MAKRLDSSICHLVRRYSLGPSDIILDGDQLAHGKRHSSPHFSAHVVCGQTAGWIKMPLGMEVGLGPVTLYQMGIQYSPTERGTAAPVSKFTGAACVRIIRSPCGQTAGWIKMPLGMDVGLGPGDIVLDGDPAPPP